MKFTVAITFLIFCLNLQGKDFAGKSFATAKDCHEFAAGLVDHYKDKPISELFEDVGIKIAEDSRESFLFDFGDRMKKESGAHRYTEQIGVSALGDFIQRIGFIVKYENMTIFYEVTIGKKEPANYTIINMSFDLDANTHDLVKRLPEYYWK